MLTAKTSNPGSFEDSIHPEKMSPINLGTSAYQDKTISFWKNPTGFVEKHLENNPSRIFLCRFAYERKSETLN
jgi:hypothetical protein